VDLTGERMKNFASLSLAEIRSTLAKNLAEEQVLLANLTICHLFVMDDDGKVGARIMPQTTYEAAKGVVELLKWQGIPVDVYNYDGNGNDSAEHQADWKLAYQYHVYADLSAQVKVLQFIPSASAQYRSSGK
jgi:hypothetical protein